MATEREQIIRQIFTLHFPDDDITAVALRLLRTAGFGTATAYLEEVDLSQCREIGRGRLPSLRVGHSRTSRVAL